MLAKIMTDSAEKSAKKEQGANSDGDEDEDENELQLDLKLKLPVMISKVDCVEHHDLCVSQNIGSYPTLRLFAEGEPYSKGDYRGQRYLMDMIQYLRKAEEELDREGKLSLDHVTDSMQKHLNVSTEERHWMEALDRIHHHHKEENAYRCNQLLLQKQRAWKKAWELTKPQQERLFEPPHHHPMRWANTSSSPLEE